VLVLSFPGVGRERVAVVDGEFDGDELVDPKDEVSARTEELSGFGEAPVEVEEAAGAGFRESVDEVGLTLFVWLVFNPVALFVLEVKDPLLVLVVNGFGFGEDSVSEDVGEAPKSPVVTPFF